MNTTFVSGHRRDLAAIVRRALDSAGEPGQTTAP